MQAVMITMEGREATVADTVSQLAEAGLDTEVFTQPSDWPVGPEGNCRNSVRALEWVVENVTDRGFLFVEDDIDVKPDRLARAVEAASGVNAVSYFYMHDIAGRKGAYPQEDWLVKMFKFHQYQPKRVPELDELVVPEGLRDVRSDQKMFGSQAVFIPTAFASLLVGHMTHREYYGASVFSMNYQAMDTALNNWRARSKVPSKVYLPHPVQHRQVKVKRKESPKRDAYSKSFGLKSDLEVRDGD